MTGVVCDHYNSSLITPQQSFPDNYKTNGNLGYMNCFTYVPCQQGGFVVGNNYNFSEGYSIDPCCNINSMNSKGNYYYYNDNDSNYPPNWNYTNDYKFSDGYNFNQCPNFYHQNNSYLKNCENNVCTDGNNPCNGKEYFEVNGTEVLPEGTSEERRCVNFTPSFFSSNSAFKRIPLQSGRSIFRRRRPGDCANEWSNAFNKDYESVEVRGDEQINN
ncbi:uncharacterized protein TA10810 [Theileria annulata]|uniref:Uncharacterized protein n=1 Tax=Theileria annulata TaxID=5874 RepID=Q4U958_THEAN|nr:uncharacterized protein TA10810 [Theileria annulata]CAI76645.1 hypothetical protein, conserved [Theileria annulata]|eukprot:XP_953270.1 hypothetical protein, conserved [Theileria annulata]